MLPINWMRTKNQLQWMANIATVSRRLETLPLAQYQPAVCTVRECDMCCWTDACLNCSCFSPYRRL